MKLRRRKPSGREKDKTSIKLLEQLREKLHSDDTSTARRAAFNLSWMQEDGLDILKEALFSDSPKRAKTAAAYGLRSMRGRMKKMALEVLRQGVEHADSGTKDICSSALSLLNKKEKEKSFSGEPGRGKLESRETPRKKQPTRKN